MRRISAAALFSVLALFPVPSAAVDDPFLTALDSELKRSIDKLKMSEMEKPYFIAYALYDSDYFTCNSTLGSKVYSMRGRSTSLLPQVRVGGYDLDGSGVPNFWGDGRAFSKFPIEPDLDAALYGIWLASDSAYKASLESYHRKKAFLKNKKIKDIEPDFSRETPVRRLEEPPLFAVDEGRWLALMNGVSGSFKKYPRIQYSRAALMVTSGAKYVVTSEGTRARLNLGEGEYGIGLRAKTRTADGSWVNNYGAVFGRFDGRYPEKEAQELAYRVAKDLEAMRQAPELDHYAGPVLFMDQSAAELIRGIFVPELDSSRPPLSEKEQAGRESRLIHRLNTRIFPDFISIEDDPTLKDYQGRELIGYFPMDDEGVMGKKLALVENGTLRSLLSTRRPRKEMPRSTGHARTSGFSGPKASITNLLIKTSGGSDEKALKEKLRQLAKDRGLEYGIMIQSLDASGITRTDPNEFLRYLMGGSERGMTVARPLVAYKVYVKDGDEKPVRLGYFSDLDVRTFKTLVAAGNSPYIHNYLNPYASYSQSSQADDFTFSGTPHSIVTPSLLLEDIAIEGKKDSVLEVPSLEN